MTYVLKFEGYWPLEMTGVASYPGIYCVHAVWETRFETTSRLLYIGEAHDIESRISSHERRRDWIRSARGDALYFSACRMTIKEGRREAEAAMIYHHQPTCNIEFKTRFPYRTTTVVSTGQNANLTPGFTVTGYTRMRA